MSQLMIPKQKGHIVEPSIILFYFLSIFKKKVNFSNSRDTAIMFQCRETGCNMLLLVVGWVRRWSERRLLDMA